MSENWRFPVHIGDIPESGRRFEIEADAPTREAVARAARVDALPHLRAVFDLTRQGNGLHITGTVSARVRQSCVVTLEPLENDIEEIVDLAFAPPRPNSLDEGANLADIDKPETLVGGVVDLGAVATEFLVLGIDPYPRKAGAVFAPPADIDTGQGPFAALKSLMKSEDEGH